MPKTALPKRDKSNWTTASLCRASRERIKGAMPSFVSLGLWAEAGMLLLSTVPSDERNKWLSEAESIRRSVGADRN